jgi:hypothetical protein
MKLLRNSLELAGYAAIVFGVWRIYPPAAWIVGGLGLLLLAFCFWALER